MTSAATAPKHRELFRATRTAQRLTPSRIWDSAFTSPVDFLRNAPRGQRARGLEIDIEAADATRDLFPTNQDAMSKRGYTADSFVGTFLDSELVRSTQLRSYRENPVIVARVPGHYYTPEAMVWQDVSSGSYLGIRRQIPILDVLEFFRTKESRRSRRRFQMSTRCFNNAAETRQ